MATTAIRSEAQGLADRVRDYCMSRDFDQYPRELIDLEDVLIGPVSDATLRRCADALMPIAREYGVA